jgi:transposase-like protein
VPEFERRWNHFAGQSGRVDETYIKIRGVWTYLYRAVDRDDKTVDFRLSPRRDVAAAKSFFRKALKTQGRPLRVITLDGYAASHRAVRELPEENGLWKDTKLRSSKYLNNIVEQDHRGVKATIGPMLVFKRFRRAKVTIAGIERLHRTRKNQFNLGKKLTQNRARDLERGAHRMINASEIHFTTVTVRARKSVGQITTRSAELFLKACIVDQKPLRSIGAPRRRVRRWGREKRYDYPYAASATTRFLSCVNPTALLVTLVKLRPMVTPPKNNLTN